MRSKTKACIAGAMVAMAGSSPTNAAQTYIGSFSGFQFDDNSAVGGTFFVTPNVATNAPQGPSSVRLAGGTTGGLYSLDTVIVPDTQGLQLAQPVTFFRLNNSGDAGGANTYITFSIKTPLGQFGAPQLSLAPGTYAIGGSSYSAYPVDLGNGVFHNNTITSGSLVLTAVDPSAKYLTSFQGGSIATPVALPANTEVDGISGNIGGTIAESIYKFSWPGGHFTASAAVGDAADSGHSYEFELHDTTTQGLIPAHDVSLNAAALFSGTIDDASLPAGNYSIGIVANGLPTDPSFGLTFLTPIGTTPEPASSMLLLLGAVPLLHRRR